MSYQDELNKFFKKRAEMFKKEGVNISMDKKMDFTYAHIECKFESLPKDAKWIEVDDDHHWDSRYESENGEGEYDFKGRINLYYADFNHDFSSMDKHDREKYLAYLYGTKKISYEDEVYEELGDWSSEYDDHNFLNTKIYYQFAYGNFTIEGKEFNDFLIISPELEYSAPWNGRYAEENYEGIKIYHPNEKKFVPVILSGHDCVSECAALEVILNDNIHLPWVEMDRIRDYISKTLS